MWQPPVWRPIDSAKASLIIFALPYGTAKKLSCCWGSDNVAIATTHNSPRKPFWSTIFLKNTKFRVRLIRTVGVDRVRCPYLRVDCFDKSLLLCPLGHRQLGLEV